MENPLVIILAVSEGPIIARNNDSETHAISAE